jgi:hypothetical protein
VDKSTIKKEFVILFLILFLGALLDYFFTGMGAGWNVNKLLEIESNEEVKECVHRLSPSYSDFWAITLCFKLKLKLLAQLLIYLPILFFVHLIFTIFTLKFEKVIAINSARVFLRLYVVFVSILQVMAGLTWYSEFARLVYPFLLGKGFVFFILFFIVSILGTRFKIFKFNQ